MSTMNSPEFFLSHDSFKNWAIGQNEEDCIIWDNWIKEHPEQQDAAMLAAQIYTGLKSGVKNLPDHEVANEWQKLKARIDSGESVDLRQKTIGNWWWKIAAALFLFVAGSWLAVFVLSPGESEYATNFSGKKNNPIVRWY